VTWSFVEYAGIHGRVANRLATAADGDVIVAGQIWTEDVMVDSGGYLWLARFSPAGAVVWSHEFAGIAVRPTDLVVATTGEIIVTGIFAGFGLASSVQVFRGDGSLMWTQAAPIGDDWLVLYEGAAVDDDGTIYLVGPRRTAIEQTQEMGHLRALSLQGSELWSVDFASPTHLYVDPTDVDLTTAGALVVALSERDEPLDPLVDSQLALATFTTAGALVWWNGWAPPEPWTGHAGPLVAALDGGVFVATAERQGWQVVRRRVARVDAEGHEMWTTVSEGSAAHDAVLGPDGLLHMLADNVYPYVP
jgi:hypothetical protein